MRIIGRKSDASRPSAEYREGALAEDTGFRPYITVLHSQLFPQPVFAAVLTGAPWRWLQIPDDVLTRPVVGQLRYVMRLCRQNSRETKGRCYLFGNITGYEWVRTPTEVVVLDVRGRLMTIKQHATPSGSGALVIGDNVFTDASVRRRTRSK